jgi:hypothetical protein
MRVYVGTRVKCGLRLTNVCLSPSGKSKISSMESIPLKSLPTYSRSAMAKSWTASNLTHLCLMRELKTTQKMRHEKVILAIVFVMFAAAIWLIMVK